ncbi:MAG: hypothetical protein OXU96_09865 [Gammaproteobacteria bacterium]|nr:hypothetical protein [Gammaproteobacteria bacterium]
MATGKTAKAADIRQSAATPPAARAASQALANPQAYREADMPAVGCSGDRSMMNLAPTHAMPGNDDSMTGRTAQ